MKSLEPYNKGLVAFVGTLLTVLAPHLGANPNFQYITGIITVLGVLHIRNAVLEDVIQDATQIVGNVTAAPPEVVTAETPAAPSLPPANPPETIPNA